MYFPTFSSIVLIFIFVTPSNGHHRVLEQKIVVNVSITQGKHPLSYLPMPASPVAFDPMPVPTYGGGLVVPTAANSECIAGQERTESNAFVMVCENGRFTPRACLMNGQRIESGATSNIDGYVISCTKLSNGIELKPTACLDDAGIPRYPGNTFVDQKNFLFECQSTSTGAVRKQVVGCVGDDQQRVTFGSKVMVRGTSADCIKIGDSARIVGQTSTRIEVSNFASPCQQIGQPINVASGQSYAPPNSGCAFQQSGPIPFNPPSSPINPNSYGLPQNSPSQQIPIDSISYAQPPMLGSPPISNDFTGPSANPSNPNSGNSYGQPAPMVNNPYQQPPSGPQSFNPGSSYQQPGLSGVPSVPDSSIPYQPQMINPGGPIPVPYQQPVSFPIPSNGASYQQPGVNPVPLLPDGPVPYQPQLINPAGPMPSGTYQQPANLPSPSASYQQPGGVNPPLPAGSGSGSIPYQPQPPNPMPSGSYQQPVSQPLPFDPLSRAKPSVEVVHEVQM